MSDERVPVVVLTGYLGAGKTTLLNYILKEQSQMRLVVIENEIGEVSIDDALVQQKHEDLAEELKVLANGCACCTIRGDLVNTLHELAEKRRSGQLTFDGVLLELTGAADPAPVIQSFIVDDECRDAYRIDNVIALIDAKHGLAKLNEHRGKNLGTACAQVAFSSTVLLNKIDLVEAASLDAIEQRIKSINSVANIVRCERGRVDMSELINVGAFSLSSVLEEQYMEEEEFLQFYEPDMDNTISNVGVRCEGAVNMFALQTFLAKYLDDEETAKDFMRIKGVFHIQGLDRIFVIQCVHMLRNQNFVRDWNNDEPRENRIIFIGRNMQQRRQELTEGFMRCVASIEGLAQRLAQGHFKQVVVCIGTGVAARCIASSRTPSASQLLLAKLAKKGWLRRVYAEDGPVEGLPEDIVVTIGGEDALKELAFVKAIHADFPRDATKDHCDLMLVLGSTLQNAPFCAVPNLARRDVPRALVMEKVNRCYTNRFSQRTYDTRGPFAVSYKSFLKLGARNVRLKPQWGPHFAGRGSSKYRQQWIFDEDPEHWASRLAAAVGWPLQQDGVD